MAPGVLSRVIPPAARAPLVVAAVLRLVAALISPGFYAMDCYFHVLDPAWRWLHDPAAPMPSDFRPAFLPLVLHVVMRLARALGAPDAFMPHAAYLAMGAWSLTLIPLCFHLARARLSDVAATWVAWLVAAQFLMPHIGTRTLVECAAAPPVAACLLFLQWAIDDPARRLRFAFAAGAALGAAGLFRMHCGVMLPVVMVLLWRAGGRRIAAQGALLVGGGLLIVVQGFVDLFTQGGFLVVPFRYAAYQAAFVNSYGVSPWYVFVALLVGLTLPPLTLALARGMGRAAWSHPVVTGPLVVFVVAHSFIGHKEERFMFTVLPLFFILLGAGLADAHAAGGWRRGGARAFVVVNTALLLLYTGADPRRNTIDPLRDAARLTPRPAVYGLDARLPNLYLGFGSHTVETRSADELLVALSDETGDHVRLILSQTRPAPSAEQLTAAGWACAEPRTYGGDVIDRLLVMVNPRNNRSRAPTSVLDCRRAKT